MVVRLRYRMDGGFMMVRLRHRMDGGFVVGTIKVTVNVALDEVVAVGIAYSLGLADLCN